MRAILPLTLVILLSLPAQSQVLYKVDLADRIDQSDVIFEGRVVDQRTEWNDARTLIQTRSRFEVYRVLAGELRHEFVEVVTQGGVIGLKATVVMPSLRLEKGDVGILFGVSPTRPRGAADVMVFEPFASIQGFIRYNVFTGAAADPFDVYPRIESLRSKIQDELGSTPQIRVDFNPWVLSAPKTSDAIPLISSLGPNPTTAGTGAEITIRGLGFELFDGGTNSAVFFANADDGGQTLTGANEAYIQSWTDTEIRVRVPTAAGTGPVTVQTASRQTGVSPEQLVVDYNRIEVIFSQVSSSPSIPDLRDRNGRGGYSFTMSTNTSDNGTNFATSQAVRPFEDALQTWQTSTGLNIRNNGGRTASNRVDPADLPDIVMFDNDAEPLPVGILARTYGAYSGCQDLLNDTIVSYLEGVDLVFRRDGTQAIDWNWGPDTTPFQEFDFESVAVHELGHAHQLGHIIADEKVMHFAIANGEDVRALDPVSDVAGGLGVFENTSNLSACGESPMIQLPPGVSTEVSDIPADFSVSQPYPNPFSSTFEFAVSAGREQVVTIEVFDMLGRSVLAPVEERLGRSARTRVQLDGADLAPGVYLVRVSGDQAGESHLVIRN